MTRKKTYFMRLTPREVFFRNMAIMKHVKANFRPEDVANGTGLLLSTVKAWYSSARSPGPDAIKKVSAWIEAQGVVL